MPPLVVEKILAGFTIKPEQLIEKPGARWNPKRSYGASKRALFEIPQSNGIYFAWSRQMAHEALESLVQAVVFHNFPTEWMTAEIKAPLDDLDNARGKWFEAIVLKNLAELGYLGRSRKDNIGSLPIPKVGVGEIDYLGFSPREKKLIVIECKMTQFTAEPKTWRDNLSKYIDGKNSYAEKFRRKRDWVLKNLESITKTISEELKIEVQPTTVSTAMVTYSPNISSCFIPDFECVSLTEFMLSSKAASSWPYALGTFEVLP